MNKKKNIDKVLISVPERYLYVYISYLQKETKTNNCRSYMCTKYLLTTVLRTYVIHLHSTHVNIKSAF